MFVFVQGLRFDTKHTEMEGDEQVKQLKSLIDSLPEPNRKSLQHIVKMCVLIDEKSSINKVSPFNILVDITYLIGFVHKTDDCRKLGHCISTEHFIPENS